VTMTDPIADMLTRIRNANVAFHDDVAMPSSKLKEAVAVILEREGYITGFEVAADPSRPGKRLTIKMKYSSDRRRTISGIKRVSSARVTFNASPSRSMTTSPTSRCSS
jgi:small subunit ribosomal protein S8